MRLLRKRIIIPSVLICFLAVLYFLFKLLLSSNYVCSAVVDSLAKKFDCNVKIDGACLGLNRLTITGLTLSYRKSKQVHEVAECILELLGDDGVFISESHYLLDLI
jgi:hypothetical protein